MCGENQTDLGCRMISQHCFLQDKRGQKHRTNKQEMVTQGEVGSVQNRHKIIKTLHVVCILCLFIGCLSDNNGWRTQRFDDLKASPSL